MIVTHGRLFDCLPNLMPRQRESNANVFDFKLSVHIMILLSKARNDQIEAEALSLQKALK